MHAFSTLFIAAAFALSVNALSADTSPVSAPVQKCIDSLTAAGNQLGTVTAAVVAFDPAKGYESANPIATEEKELQSRLDKANVDCCAEYPTVTSHEADAVFDVVDVFVPKTKDTLTQIQNAKSKFDQLSLVSSAIKKEIYYMETQTKALATCLIKRTPQNPSSYLEHAKARFNDVDSAFAAAKTAYSTA